MPDPDPVPNPAPDQDPALVFKFGSTDIRYHGSVGHDPQPGATTSKTMRPRSQSSAQKKPRKGTKGSGSGKSLRSQQDVLSNWLKGGSRPRPSDDRPDPHPHCPGPNAHQELAITTLIDKLHLKKHSKFTKRVTNLKSA